METSDRYSSAAKTLGQSLVERIRKSKVLMVGAGGIGCELLKDLALTGFGEIHIVDLDTIDLSNLNRQFLFRKEHIKKSKAIEAKKSAAKFNPDVNILPYHANIKDAQFNVGWFRSFDLVFNALDNLDARRHVNRLCLAADTPLIESGTAGFNGQVQVIVAGKTECYDCNPKPVTKSFPVCTIRSTPSQPIHCIVWAKNYLFSQLFESDSEATAADNDNDTNGKSPKDESMKDEDGNELSAEEKQTILNESNELKELRQSLLQDPDFGKRMFNKIFKHDIERLLTMESMWKTRKPPKPLQYDDILAGMPGDLDVQQLLTKDQRVWSLEENVAVLLDSLQRLIARKRAGVEENGGGDFGISFDKDDDDTLDFVVAAANVRSHMFSIEVKSKFDVKQIAGNIIPAIATTNAIIAGVCVLQSFKVIQDKLDEARMVFLSKQPDRVFSTEKLQPPNPYCVVSGVARAVVKTNPDTTTLGDLVESLLRLDLGYSEELSIVTDKLVYDPDFDDNVTRTLADLNIKDGSFITVIDEEEENTKVNLELYIEGGDKLEGKYVIENKPTIGLRPKPKVDVNANSDAIDDDGDLTIEEQPNTTKRRLDSKDDESAKKTKLDDPATENLIVIDDGDEVIAIDD